MPVSSVSQYNRDQWRSFRAIREAFRRFSPSERKALRRRIQPYVEFRRTLDEFQTRFFGAFCTKTCFETGLSACCGFESIFTFFADQVVTFLMSSEEDTDRLLEVLERPNTSERCVYLGEGGCLWKVRPISCTMFLCDEAKQAAFSEHPKVEEAWEAIQKMEREFTWPDKPVLFDELEKSFMAKGADSPHLYFHKSPGLLRVKAKAGLF